MASVELSLTLAIALVAGLIRGMTGFGGALVMTPPLSLLIGPKYAVLTALLLEVSAAANMLPGALRQMRLRTIGPICVMACITVPLGTYLLLILDAEVTRRCIAGMVVAFSALMLAGFRYPGNPRLVMSAALGALSGVLLGATSMGAPPIILYLLAGQDSVALTRAHLIIYITVVSIVGLGMLWVTGIFDLQSGIRALAAAPFFIVGTLGGSRLFERVDERQFRRFTLLLLMAVSSVILMV